MRKILLILLGILLSYSAFSQKQDTAIARIYLDSAEIYIDSAKYDRALFLGKSALEIYKKEVGEVDTLRLRALDIVCYLFLKKIE